MNVAKVIRGHESEETFVSDIATEVEHTDMDEYGVTLYLDNDVYVVIGKEEMLDWISNWMDVAGKALQEKLEGSV